MKCIVNFTQEELYLVLKALQLGSIHTNDDTISDNMNVLRSKIQMLIAINNE